MYKSKYNNKEFNKGRELIYLGTCMETVKELTSSSQSDTWISKTPTTILLRLKFIYQLNVRNFFDI